MMNVPRIVLFFVSFLSAWWVVSSAEHDLAWSTGMSSDEQAMSAAAGDTITFTWSYT
eukprot:CAMPEP_0119496360 /NCGR_PEP_ID=MMETSP1344-20130328/19720_1 /TAXON_ID=236787 /ORGANISM="Florenciella parvula, Strain CCMP2471" /LENGTH=56 /DNA_ID=CAMNT_0007532043 /DNA_START=88 /DNA_END=254 /DNA_ORIENTATION=+